MLKVAIIGTGTMAGVHLNALSSIPTAQAVAIWGRTEASARKLGEQYGLEVYEDVDQLLANAEIDAVVICLPTFLHAEYTIRAAQSKKHVICEKPIALTSAEAIRMRDVCSENGVILYVGQVLRFAPEYAAAKQYVEEGKIGTPGVFRLSRLNKYPHDGDSWYSDEEKSGGIVYDLLIHDFDWVRWALGDVDRVTTLRTRKELDETKLEYIQVLLRMTSGAIVYCEASWAHTYFHSSMELSGSKGMIVNQDKDTQPIIVDILQSDSSTPGVIVQEHVLHKGLFQRQWEHIAECILNGATPLVTPDDAIQAVVLAEAAKQSIQTGEPVIVKGEGEQQ